MSYSPEQLTGLVDELRKLPSETEWLEFKVNNSAPDTLGQNIAALSNSATLHDKEKGYIVFGIDNKSHQVVGTKFKPHRAHVGSEELEHWLAKMLDP